MADNCACKNTARRNQKSGRFHVRNLAKAMLVSLTILIATPLTSHAHTGLVSSSPAENSTIQSFPSEIILTFNEDLMTIGEKQVSKFSIHKPDHELVQIGKFKIDKGTISAAVKESDLPTGTYKIYYRVISADGHPVSGVLKFNYKVASSEKEIVVLKSFDFSHFWHLHSWHTIEAIAVIALVTGWWIYRRRNSN
jgi:methionine-rich copper-binding protein CopC